MASSIDATKPTTGSALTSDVRDNFSAAKTEIEALQTDKATLADLASTTDAAKGSALVGIFRSVTGFVGRTLSSWISSRPYYVEDFGAIGDGVTDDSAAIRAAIAAAAGDKVCLRSARYVYDGDVITDDVVKVVGARMPTINAGFTSLENGAIIEGRFRFTGTDVHLENLGADLGSDTAAVSGDPIKCTAPIGTGKHCHLENVVGLGKSSSDAFHAVLVEGYAKLTGGNITGAHNYFSVVMKCTDVQIGAVYGYRSSSDGLYLKSDATNGDMKYANIDSVIIDGNSGQTFGLRLQSDGAQLDTINIGKVIIKDCERAYKADVNGTLGVGIKEVNITDFTSINSSTRDIDLACDKAGTFIYTHSMDRVKCIGTVVEGIKASGVGTLNHITFGDVLISYDAGTSAAQMLAGGITFGSTVLNTSLDQVTICQAYSTATLGGINYANPAANNKIGIYAAYLAGIGVPLNGYSAPDITGATATITPPDNWKEKSSTVKASLSGGAATVTTIAITRYTSGPNFEIGHILTIINNSVNILTINHNFGGNILNKSSANVAIPANETGHWIFGGSVWHEL